MPSRESLERNRWLRWLGPALGHPRLWHLSRRGVALGVALGVFFGLLIPIAQIPFSVGLAVALRANVPAAAASTLITNPVTFGPVYYAAWHLGSFLLGEKAPASTEEALATPAMPATPAAEDASWWRRAMDSILGVGKPLLLGLAILASLVGLLAYFLISWAWAVKVWWTRRRRLQAVGR